MGGAVSRVEGIADELCLLLGDDEGVGDVEQSAEGGVRGCTCRWSGSPSGVQVQGRGVGFEEGGKVVEEGKEDGISRSACGGGIVQGVELGGEGSVVKGEAGVEDLRCSLPKCWIAAEETGRVELWSKWHDYGGISSCILRTVPQRENSPPSSDT